MNLASVTLEQKYELERGSIYLSGIQSLVRLPLMQRRLDKRAGVNTAGFISGYRGSPLGGYDLALWSAKHHLDRHQIYFQPGLNEDLAATAVWGSQQANIFPQARYDGVFGIWYGKGPGVFRSIDVITHANYAGTTPHGGVLLMLGDDHAAKSSTLPHQSDQHMIGAMIPILNPAGVQDLLDLGLFGWALSRYSGCWVSMKCIVDTMDGSASIEVDPDRIAFAQPTDFEMPAGGLHIRWPDDWHQQEFRHHNQKIAAALAFARANRLDHVALKSAKPRFGIITTGKSYLDVREALDYLGIDLAEAVNAGIAIYRVRMTWPLEPEGVRRFAEGLDEVFVVEEKQPIVESQVKSQLYSWDATKRPRVVGKIDENGEKILPTHGEISTEQIATAIAKRIRPFLQTERMVARLTMLERKESERQSRSVTLKRTPYFCSGCPHNTSTRLPEGSRAGGGIGCHFMALYMDRGTETFTQMGGEGAQWIGQAPFTETSHIFQNLGDGTYTHSGSLAIRAAVAAGVNITFKLLYNDAVAMTGGQRAEGHLSVADIGRQVAAEGVRRIAIVTDEPEKYPDDAGLPAGATIDHRDALETIQRELREIKGVSVLIYDQTCAAEKRRRRKRGTYSDPAKRVVINDLVCEGCGDCGMQSNCLSIIPVETELGRKRGIDQSTCNKDMSCVRGFCPAFVTVLGGKLRGPMAAAGTDSGVLLTTRLPEPAVCKHPGLYNMLVAGIGGTGVVTIGALLGMAAHLEGKACSILDMTGLSQKAGAVFSHVRIADSKRKIHAARVPKGDLHLLLGCDIMVAASDDALDGLSRGLSNVVINSFESMTGAFTRDPDLRIPSNEFLAKLRSGIGTDALHVVDGTSIVTSLLGDSIAANGFMLGFAYQKGLIPLSAQAIERAIELNGVAVDMNLQAFRWGRLSANNPKVVQNATAIDTAPAKPEASQSLDDIVARRVSFLTVYQSKAYATSYAIVVRKAEAIEKQRCGADELTRAVARYYFKLLAYKDEYEVARLHTDRAFHEGIAAHFEGDYTLQFSLAPPILSKRDPVTGRPRKTNFGAWIMPVFRVLAMLRFLRGTIFDAFGYTEERREERRLIVNYEERIHEILSTLSLSNHTLAVELASLPEFIRGYGSVKKQNLVLVKQRETKLLAQFRSGGQSKVTRMPEKAHVKTC